MELLQDLSVIYLPPQALTPYEGNARKHAADDIAQIKESIRQERQRKVIGNIDRGAEHFLLAERVDFFLSGFGFSFGLSFFKGFTAGAFGETSAINSAKIFQIRKSARHFSPRTQLFYTTPLTGDVKTDKITFLRFIPAQTGKGDDSCTAPALFGNVSFDRPIKVFAVDNAGKGVIVDGNRKLGMFPVGLFCRKEKLHHIAAPQLIN